MDCRAVHRDSKTVIVLAEVQTYIPCAGFGGALDSEAILDFVDAGHNLILAVDSRASDEIRNLASDLGVDFESQGSLVIDATNHVALAKSVDTSLITSEQFLSSPAIFGDKAVAARSQPSD